MLFTYDDHQAGTAFQEAPGQPNRIRCVRDARWKYAVYLDPSGRRGARVRALRPRRRPDEAVNLVDKRTGRAARPRPSASAARLHERLAELLDETATAAPVLPPA